MFEAGAFAAPRSKNEWLALAVLEGRACASKSEIECDGVEGESSMDHMSLPGLLALTDESASSDSGS